MDARTLRMAYARYDSALYGWNVSLFSAQKIQFCRIFDLKYIQSGTKIDCSACVFAVYLFAKTFDERGYDYVSDLLDRFGIELLGEYSVF